MPGFIGKKLCPDLVIVPCNFKRYKEISSVVREVFAKYDPNFCPMSLDEAYLDVTDYLTGHPGKTPGEIVKEMRKEIEERTQLTASAGISFNSRLAKICSDLNKPNGQYELLNEAEAKALLNDLPVRKVGGIGNVTEQLLKSIGVEKCSDILDHKGLIFHLFSELSAEHFFGIALGMGSTNVADMANRERKSMSTETTFRDTSEPAKLREICQELCQELSRDLQKENLVGRQVTVKIKTHKFAIKTRVANLISATSESSLIFDAASKVLNYFMETASEKPLTLRLLGVRMSEFNQTSNGDFNGADQSEFPFGDGEDASSRDGKVQLKLDKFMINNAGPTVDAKVFSCPICECEVTAKSEAAFNQTHFEDCLTNGGGVTNDKSESEEKVPDPDAVNHVDHNSEEPRPSTSDCSTITKSLPSVTCPVCSKVVKDETAINSHLDECLNSSAITKFSGGAEKRKLNSKPEIAKRAKTTGGQSKILTYFQ